MGGAFGPGLGICALGMGLGWAFHTRDFESSMDAFIGKDAAFVEQWLVRQGLEKLVDVFEGNQLTRTVVLESLPLHSNTEQLNVLFTD